MEQTKIGKLTLDLWKKDFDEILSSVQRTRILDLLEYLHEDTDFYNAPSSSKYHGAYKGGLLEHSLNVYKNLKQLSNIYKTNLEDENIIIIALLHDLCKTNFYIQAVKNVKRKDEKGNFIFQNGKNIWDEEIYYDFNDSLPLGHGEKSVIIAQKFIPLTNLEIMCIRWHMMAYDDSTRGYGGNLALTRALELYPEISLVHSADLLSISMELKL
jgi:hypothetical protein